MSNVEIKLDWHMHVGEYMIVTEIEGPHYDRYEVFVVKHHMWSGSEFKELEEAIAWAKAETERRKNGR